RGRTCDGDDSFLHGPRRVEHRIRGSPPRRRGRGRGDSSSQLVTNLIETYLALLAFVARIGARRRLAMTALLSLALAGCPTDNRTLTSSEDTNRSGDSGLPDGDSGLPDSDACSNGACGCGDVSSDPKNCGACGHDCTAVPRIDTPGDVKCSASKCVIAGSACAAGYADCNGDPADGCETDLSKPEHCGSCTTTCAAGTPLCTPNGCNS